MIFRRRPRPTTIPPLAVDEDGHADWVPRTRDAKAADGQAADAPPDGRTQGGDDG